jgi:hypothetical protein
MSGTFVQNIRCTLNKKSPVVQRLKEQDFFISGAADSGKKT